MNLDPGLSTPTPRLIFFGNERLATGVTTTAPILTGLIEAGYDIKAVVSNYDAGQSRQKRELEIKHVAEEHQIPLLLPDKPSEIIDQLKTFGAEAAVLAAYGKIVPQAVIDLFPKGIINVHPSLLPLHRGPTPIESVILAGAAKTGVSLMRLTRDMDAGPVYAQSEVELTGQETKQELADRLSEIGAAMLVELLPDILRDRINAIPQDNDSATYDGLLSKADGLVDWRQPAERLAREIRAFAGWPGSRGKLGNIDVIITKAYPVPSTPPETKPGDITVVPEANAIAVVTGNGSLWITRLKPAGKREMSAGEFLTGYRKKLGL